MQLKASAKSQKIFPSCIFWLVDLNTLSVSLQAASSVDIPFLNTYFPVTSMMFVYNCWFNLLCIAFWNTLGKKTVNNDIGLVSLCLKANAEMVPKFLIWYWMLLM